MRIFAPALSGLFLSMVAATAQTDDYIMKQAIGETAGDLQICSVYFMIGSTCLTNQRPDLAASYQQSGEKVLALAIAGFQSVGVSDAAITAQGSMYTEAMMNAMNRNCTNIAVLLQRYLKFCQQLSQGPDLRLKEWIACARANQPTCGGPGLP